MHDRYGPLFKRLYGFFFRRVEPDLQALSVVREASQRGPVVFVMGQQATLEYLFFNWYFLRYGLPLTRFANGINMFSWMPLRRALRTAIVKVWIRGRSGPLPDPVDSGFMRRQLLAGRSVMLFLKGRAKLARRGRQVKQSMIEEVLAAQRKSTRPVFLVPQTIVWQRRPDRVRPRLLDMFFGSDEEARSLTRTLHFFLYAKGAVVRMGEPINLREFIAQNPDDSAQVLAKKLRWMLLGYLYRERRSVKGPQVKPREWMFKSVRDDPEIRRYIEREAGGDPALEAELRGEVQTILRSTAANLHWDWLYGVRWFFDLVLNRIYDGVEISEESLNTIRGSMRRGPVLFLPSHRSHLDYILLSWILFHNYMMCPHVAAGINLSFWPVGPILRRCGAFFLRRSFGGDGLYSLVFTKYLHALIREGYPSEFFIEGGRSRTGKLLMPKTGLLRMYVNAVTDRVAPDLLLLPVGIGYERIVEERAYRNELTGGTKVAENVSGLARSARILNRSYGRVHLRVDEPMSVKEWLAGFEGDWSKVDPGERHLRIQALGRLIVYRIGRATMVTPSMLAAATLLGPGSEGMEQSEYLRRYHLFKSVLRECRVPLSEAIEYGEVAALEALASFASEGWIELVADPDVGRIITINPDRRLSLDYYRNGMLVHLVMGTYVASVVLERSGSTTSTGDIVAEVERLERMLERELLVDPDAERSEQVSEWLALLAARGAVRQEEDGFRAADGDLCELLASLLGPLRESYELSREVLLEHCGEAHRKDEWMRLLLAEGRKRRLTGELRYRESLNKVTFGNVLEILRHAGLWSQEDGRVVLADAEGIDRVLGGSPHGRAAAREQDVG
jgi:glycerol-3-phosphate O-acyltransferase